MAECNTEIIASGYDQVADEYEALEAAEAPWPRLERVRAFAADLPQGSRVLDIGCGNGVPATRELALKHSVTGVDISEEQIARARANVPTATFIRGDAREVDLPMGAFDAIVALYLIDHIGRESRVRISAGGRPPDRICLDRRSELARPPVAPQASFGNAGARDERLLLGCGVMGSCG